MKAVLLVEFGNFLVLFLLASARQGQCAVPKDDDVHLWQRLQNNAKKPPFQGKLPLDVNIGVYIESLGKFKSEEMSFDADVYLYMSWRDVSLNHTNPDYILISDPVVKQHIWQPGLYFANSRSSHFHDVTVPNFNLFIAQDGTVAYSSRITLTIACNLNLVNYPMDAQICTIRTLSYAYIASQVNVTWFNTQPIRYNPEIGLPEFNIMKIEPAYCDGTYIYAIMDNSYKQDHFSCLEAVISLKRSIGYHLVQTFIPTGLIVIVSWVSFWIDRRAAPARVTLSFTTLLSLSTLSNGLRFGLPQVAYVKSIDLWFGACMFFVFASLLEYAIVNSYIRLADKYERLSQMAVHQKRVVLTRSSVRHLWKYRTKRADENDNPSQRASSTKKTFDDCSTEGTFVSDDETPVKLAPRKSYVEVPLSNGDGGVNSAPLEATRFAHLSLHFSHNAHKLDKRSRILFPTTFICFNAIYWVYYLWYVQL